MKFSQLPIQGAYLIELERRVDERGFFARQFCRREFAAKGIDFEIKQCNLSGNISRGTLRGMHYQKSPYPEIKIVSCMKGRVYDVIVDLRADSATYLKWFGMEMSGDDGKSIYIPAGVAHGFQTLEDDTTIYYQLGEFFVPECYAGVRWNDPKIGIVWPACDNRIINERDNSYEFL